jgi:hypothetical protein
MIGEAVRRASHIRWASAPAPFANGTRTTRARRIVAARLRWDIARMPATTFMYVETDIPEGMSLDAWRRRDNAAHRRPTRLARLWRAIAG